MLLQLLHNLGRTVEVRVMLGRLRLSVPGQEFVRRICASEFVRQTGLVLLRNSSESTSPVWKL
jgi:hypothetical protein